jgi:phytoene dehydrogenase-like protein
MTLRPRTTLKPYSTGIEGVFICSAATPPGGGVHGMNGYNAAREVLRGNGVRINLIPQRRSRSD